MYREQLTRDAFINGLASPVVRQRLLEKEELSLNQAFELADNLDRAHRYSSCMGPLVPDQSLSMMTSDSTAKNSCAAAYTRRSSSTVVEAVSCCVLPAMSPVIFVENGVISPEPVGLKLHQMMFCFGCYHSLRLSRLGTNPSLLRLQGV